MASPENTSFDNFDPIDFGEPTPETRALFARTLDSLKNLAVSKVTFEVDDIIGDLDIEAAYGISRSDLCPITQYTYDQMTDPLFGPHDEVYFMFQLTDGDPDKIQNWYDIMGQVPLNGIHYEGTDLDIMYDSSFDIEMLYITEPKDPVPSIFSDDFAPIMMDRVKRHMQAINVGASNPTEGSMRRLIEVLEQEIAKRIVSN